MKHFSISLPVVSVLAGLVTIGAEARQAPSPTRAKIDVSKLGPQVGERVPAFSLPDQTGRARTLDSIMGPKGTMLVFIRSADW